MEDELAQALAHVRELTGRVSEAQDDLAAARAASCTSRARRR
ncbi:hypothetical protein ACH40F_51830 [Streptomyces sp. NPDC020794]